MRTTRLTASPISALGLAVALVAALAGCGDPAAEEAPPDDGCLLTVEPGAGSNADGTPYRIASGEEGTGASINCSVQSGGCTWQLLSQAMPGRSITGRLSSPAGTPETGATFTLALPAQGGTHLSYSEPYDGGRRHWQATSGSIEVEDSSGGRVRLRVDATLAVGDQNEVGTGTFRLEGSCTVVETP